MNTKHTPGPWRVEHRTVWSSEFRICQLDAGGRTNKGDIAQANAQLIAAAPEILEALKNLVDCYGDCFGKPDLDRANDIINKAEGRN